MATDEIKGIGDIHSKEAGTAARFNAGKWKAQYLPLHYLARQLYDEFSGNPALEVLETLAKIQGEPFEYDECSERLICAYSCLADLMMHEDKEPSSCLWRLLELECEVWDFGAKKYAQWNWTKGMPWSAVIASATRHLTLMLMGELVDRESGIHHAGHVACNLRMLMFYLDYYPEGNDLPGALWAKPQSNPDA